MPSIRSQKDARPAQSLGFCYKFGGAILSKKDDHPDHIPPRCIFAACDRNFPLMVSCHRDCNSSNSVRDEVIGQLIAVLHGKHPAPGKVRLDAHWVTMDDGPQYAGFVNTDVEQQIFRWVRGFHAALYAEFLPESTRYRVFLPFPRAVIDSKEMVVEQAGSAHRNLVRVIKHNRAAGTLDCIACNNGKCRYECTWIMTTKGRSSCVFALQLYDWSSLGAKELGQRGCVGQYVPEAGRSPLASEATSLYVRFFNEHKADPFKS